MRKHKQLSSEARKEATGRGHTLTRFQWFERETVGLAICTACDMEVHVIAKPSTKPTILRTLGSALEKYCPKRFEVK